MAHDGDSALRQEFDGRRNHLAAFDLDACGTGFLQQPRGVGKGLFGRGFIAAKRHVDDDRRMIAAAHHSRAVQRHHLHRHRDSMRQAIDHLCQRIADQQHVAMRVH